MSTKGAFYAVARGRKVGIYPTWDAAKVQVTDFKGAKYKKFATQVEAQAFINGVEAPIVGQQTSILDFFELPKEDPKEGERNLIVFTDGACIHNGKPNARASFATVWPEHPEMDYGARVSDGQVQTNNRGEYWALLHALRQAEVLDPSKQKTLLVYTDSQLMINSLTLWLRAWKKNNWIKSDGAKVANIDLLENIDACLHTRKIVFRHVKAHTGQANWEARYNDKVDRLAQSQLAK